MVGISYACPGDSEDRRTERLRKSIADKVPKLLAAAAGTSGEAARQRYSQHVSKT